jgi:hypothetical protein
MSIKENEALFEQVKEQLVANERLFIKLRRTAEQYRAIDFDESGLYDDDEATALRHWDKLTSKVVTALNETIQGYEIVRAKERSPEEYCVDFKIFNEEDAYHISVSYLDDNELRIS